MNYDYIIVGAGSAGCTIANRLSENPDHSILLIEAGGKDWRPEIHIPAAYSRLHNSSVDWAYKTTPQPGVNNRIIHQPRGKALGGSSSTNCMAYIRGHKLDYDEWAELGNEGWGYEDVLPYFIKSENNEQLSNEYHGQGGPLNVTKSKDYITPLGEAFIKACELKGIPPTDDFNGEEQIGAGFFQFTIKDFKRGSTASTFLKEAKSRRNLKILSKTHTRKVIIENQKAVGVEVQTGRKVYAIHANKEVILAAGAFGSPHILMLSGVGNKDHLEEVGVTSVHHLPGVGQNLQDHLILGLCCTTEKPVSFNTKETLGNMLNYLINKKGPFSASPLEACAFYKTNPELERPDMQLHFAPAHGTDMHDHRSFPRKKDGYSILPTLIRPKSVGEITLKSADPFEYPNIDPKYFSDPEDLEIMMRGVKMALELFRSEPFDEFRERISMPEKHETDEDLINHIMDKVETCYHPVGTCKMGHDEMAVVDDQLRVHGIKNLRVADASIMPTVPTGNTNAPTIMIAEKAADMIKGVMGIAVEKASVASNG